MRLIARTLIVLLTLLPFLGQAQMINDCPKAKVICDNSNLVFNPDGPGYNDFADPDNHPGCITALEQNSAWYYFQINPNAPPDLVLGFIIHPNGGYGEDYDWALYGPNVNCGELGNPIRCSSSSAMCGFCPETGMGMGTTDVTEGPGTGDGFVSTLVVQPGQGFYLMIDNWLGTDNGFVMEWTESAADWLNCDAEPPCALSAIAGADLEACEGDELIQLNGSSIGQHGNETYMWSGTNGGTAFLSDPDIRNPQINLPLGFSGTITYTLTVSEDTCHGEDALDLLVYPLPVVTLTPVNPLCENASPVTLTAVPGGGVWGGDATGNTFNPTTNGPGIHTVTYAYTDLHGCVGTAEMDIEVYEAPTGELDPDPAEFCDSDAPQTLTASGSGGAGGYMFHWNTPSGMDDGNTYSASVSGAYHITVTDANGCTNTVNQNVIFHPNPTVEIVDPGPLCTSMDFFQIAADPPGGNFFGNYVSSTGDISPHMIPPGVFQVSYTYINSFNCEATDYQDITILPTPNANASNNGPQCQGLPIQLFGSTDSVGTDISYLWSGPNGYVSTAQNPTDASSAGTYQLFVSIDGCASPAATTDVVLTPAPDASASNDGPYCNGQSIQLFGNTNAGGNIIEYAWTGPNGYTSASQNPSDATVPGLYSLVITVDNCPSAAAQTNVIFSTPPDANATNGGPYCTGSPVTLFGNINTSGTTISYAWTGPNGYASSAQNPIDATIAGQYALIVNVDGCQSAPDTTAVLINALPQPVITGPNSFCTGNSAILDAGGGYTGYVWSTGGQNQTLQVSTSGIYTVTVTDANGCKNSTAMDVNEVPSLTPLITGALEFCEGGNTILDAGPGFSTYSWSTGETSQAITVSTGGNFGVIVTDATGCNGSTNITTIEHQNPNVVIGGSTTYCIGGFTVLDAGAGYSSYLWNDNSTNQTLIASSPGQYAVSVVDNFGCSGSASVMVDESTSLHPVITGSDKFCQNGNTVLNAGTGFATYIWSDNSTNQTLTVNTAGSYSVTVSDGQGCSGEATVAVSEVLPPSATLKPGATLCNTIAGGSVIDLYSLITAGDMNGSWQDIDQSGAVGLFDNLNFNNIPAGNYHYRYTTNSAIAPCPEESYDVVITIMDCTCPEVLFINTNPLCNESDQLDLSTIENTTEAGAWSILQSPSGSNPAKLTGKIFNATDGDPGQYVLQFTLQNQPPPGCPLNYQVNINVDQSVHAGIAAAPVAYCADEDQTVDLAGLITGEDANGTWTETSASPSQGGAFNSTNATFKTKDQAAGTYTFEYALQAGGACPDHSTTVAIVVNPLPVVVVDDIAIIDCANPTQSLDGNGSSTGAGFGVLWSGPGILLDGNQNTLHPNINQAGNYLLTITNNQTGCKNSATVTVVANTDPPTAALIASHDPACFSDQNGFININQVIGGTAPYQYSLNNSPFSGTNTFSSLAAGDYNVVAMDANGCLWDTLITFNEPAEVDITLGPDITVEFGQSATVQASVNISSAEIDTVTWSPDDIISCFDMDCLEGNVTPYQSGTLTATLIDVNGCEDVDQLIITVDKRRKVYIPTAFSPNGDGVNDIFYVFGSDHQIRIIKKFQVFNRWGELLHEKLNFMPNDPSSGWNGTFKNELMNPAVFVYRVEIEFIDGVEELYTGDVTLSR